MNINLNPHSPWPPSTCLGWNILKTRLSGTICKIAIFVGIWEKLLLFENQVATVVAISKKSYTFLMKVQHFLGNLQICYF